MNKNNLAVLLGQYQAARGRVAVLTAVAAWLNQHLPDELDGDGHGLTSDMIVPQDTILGLPAGVASEQAILEVESMIGSLVEKEREEMERLVRSEEQ